MARVKALKRNLPDTDSESDAPTSTTKPAKKARKSSQAAEPGHYTAEEPSHFFNDELIQHILSLQSQLEAAKNTSTTPAAPASELSKEALDKKVTQLQTLMERQIRKAMTWKPSCKTVGGAAFSQDFLVPVEEVVRQIFRPVVSEKDAKKGWKMKKFGVEEFEKAVGEEVVRSTRYASLYLKGDVTVRYNAGDGIMKCSGRYGLM